MLRWPWCSTSSGMFACPRVAHGAQVFAAIMPAREVVRGVRTLLAALLPVGFVTTPRAHSVVLARVILGVCRGRGEQQTDREEAGEPHHPARCYQAGLPLPPR